MIGNEAVDFCNYGDHSGVFKGFFRAYGWVACLKCCKGMTKKQYQRMVNKHCKTGIEK